MNPSRRIVGGGLWQCCSVAQNGNDSDADICQGLLDAEVNDRTIFDMVINLDRGSYSEH
jgi:hypothetical protein